jgi:hypothetical protein
MAEDFKKNENTMDTTDNDMSGAGDDPPSVAPSMSAPMSTVEQNHLNIELALGEEPNPGSNHVPQSGSTWNGHVSKGFDSKSAWFHVDDDDDKMSCCSGYSHLTSASSDLSDILHMFVEEDHDDKCNFSKNISQYQVSSNAPTLESKHLGGSVSSSASMELENLPMPLPFATPPPASASKRGIDTSSNSPATGKLPRKGGSPADEVDADQEDDFEGKDGTEDDEEAMDDEEAVIDMAFEGDLAFRRLTRDLTGDFLTERSAIPCLPNYREESGSEGSQSRGSTSESGEDADENGTDADEQDVAAENGDETDATTSTPGSASGVFTAASPSNFGTPSTPGSSLSDLVDGERSASQGSAVRTRPILVRGIPLPENGVFPHIDQFGRFERHGVEYEIDFDASVEMVLNPDAPPVSSTSQAFAPQSSAVVHPPIGTFPAPVLPGQTTSQPSIGCNHQQSSTPSGKSILSQDIKWVNIADIGGGESFNPLSTVARVLVPIHYISNKYEKLAAYNIDYNHVTCHATPGVGSSETVSVPAFTTRTPAPYSLSSQDLVTTLAEGNGTGTAMAATRTTVTSGFTPANAASATNGLVRHPAVAISAAPVKYELTETDLLASPPLSPTTPGGVSVTSSDREFNEIIDLAFRNRRGHLINAPRTSVGCSSREDANFTTQLQPNTRAPWIHLEAQQSRVEVACTSEACGSQRPSTVPDDMEAESGLRDNLRSGLVRNSGGGALTSNSNLTLTPLPPTQIPQSGTNSPDSVPTSPSTSIVSTVYTNPHTDILPHSQQAAAAVQPITEVTTARMVANIAAAVLPDLPEGATHSSFYLSWGFFPDNLSWRAYQSELCLRFEASTDFQRCSSRFSVEGNRGTLQRFLQQHAKEAFRTAAIAVGLDERLLETLASTFDELSEDTWELLTCRLLDLSGLDPKWYADHGMRSHPYDSNLTYQNLPSGYNRGCVKAIRTGTLDAPVLQLAWDGSSKRNASGIPQIGFNETNRITGRTAVSVLSSPDTIFSNGEVPIRTSIDEPLPYRVPKQPDQTTHWPYYRDSLEIMAGFCMLCLASIGDDPRAVRFNSDSNLVNAFNRYVNVRNTPVSSLDIPVWHFLHGRYLRSKGLPNPFADAQPIVIGEVDGAVQGMSKFDMSTIKQEIRTSVVNNTLLHHVSSKNCTRCGGYILQSDLPSTSILSLQSPALHPDLSTCLFQLSIVDAHLKGRLTELQRLQLLNERTDESGRHFCLTCNRHVDNDWDEGKGHGVVNAQSRKYHSICKRIDKMTTDFCLADDRLVSNSNIVNFSPIEDISSSKSCKYISHGSSSQLVPPSLNISTIDVLHAPLDFSNRPTNQQRLFCSDARTEDGDMKLKTVVSTSRDDTSAFEDFSKFSEEREADERATHGDIGNVRHRNESGKKGPNSPLPFVREHLGNGKGEHERPHILCSPEKDFSENWPQNQNNSSSSFMIDQRRPIQHSERRSSQPAIWSRGENGPTTNRVYHQEQPGPFGINDEGGLTRGVEKAVREHSFMLPPGPTPSRNTTQLPPAPRDMGRFVAPVRQESYSHDNYGKGYGYDSECSTDRERRHHQGVQWSEEGSLPNRDRRPPTVPRRQDNRPLRSTSPTRYIAEREDIDDGQTPYYMTQNASNLQTKAKPATALALTPYVKSEVDSDSDVVILPRTRKSLKKKPIKLYPTEDGDSSDSDSQYTDKTDDKTSIFSLFSTMTCDAEHTEALLTLKSMLKKSDFIEVKYGDRGQRRNVRFSDYFSEKYSGNPRKLKRYLQRLLQYSALSTTDDETRADIVGDGPGLAELCLIKLEQAARVPLPGLASTYDTDSISQKKRLLDLLLTYVILFFQEEQTLALQDLRLRGPMFTGLTDLYHKINTGSTLLHPKHMEDYLLRGILRAENGDGVSLLKSFQNTLRIQKQMELKYSKDDQVYRKLLFTCCNLHTTEDSQVQLTPTITQPVKGGGRRFEQTNYARLDWDVYEDLIEEYTAMAEASPAHNPDYQNRGRNDRRQPVSGQDKGRNDSRSQREELFTKRFCMAPCACCGAKNHPMLSPIKSPDGAPLDCDYVCPTAICSNWQEQRRQRNALRFQPCPKKFAAMCHNDTATADKALSEYERIGSGQYRNPSERNAFRRDVLMNCKAPVGSGNYPKRNTSGGSQVEQCHSSSVWLVNECRNIEDNPPLLCGNNADVKDKRITVLEFETNGVSTTPAPSVLGYSSLHLLLATRIEPATEEEIETMKRGDWERMITRVDNGSVMTREGGRGCKVRFQMPYGIEYVVRYPEVCGRILADTGSTTSLINTDFARSRGLEILTTGAEIVLRDVNNGLSSLVDHCILRLTLTTIMGEHINILILAHCVKNLGHDLLLGTRDLERYQISVMAHRGESQMQINDTIEYLPMLDGLQISQLQRLTLGDKPMC